jgi:hypothetical protein
MLYAPSFCAAAMATPHKKSRPKDGALIVYNSQSLHEVDDGNVRLVLSYCYFGRVFRKNKITHRDWVLNSVIARVAKQAKYILYQLHESIKYLCFAPARNDDASEISHSSISGEGVATSSRGMRRGRQHTRHYVKNCPVHFKRNANYKLISEDLILSRAEKNFVTLFERIVHKIKTAADNGIAAFETRP